MRGMRLIDQFFSRWFILSLASWKHSEEPLKLEDDDAAGAAATGLYRRLEARADKGDQQVSM